MPVEDPAPLNLNRRKSVKDGLDLLKPGRIETIQESVRSEEEDHEKEPVKLHPVDVADPAIYEKFEYNSFDSADSDDFSDYEDFLDNKEHKQDLVTNVVKKPRQEMQWNCREVQTEDPNEGLATKIYNWFFKK